MFILPIWNNQKFKTCEGGIFRYKKMIFLLMMLRNVFKYILVGLL